MYYFSTDPQTVRLFLVGLNLYRLNKIVPMDESSDLKKKQSSIIRDREKVETFAQNPARHADSIEQIEQIQRNTWPIGRAMTKETEDFSTLDIQANSF